MAPPQPGTEVPLAKPLTNSPAPSPFRRRRPPTSPPRPSTPLGCSQGGAKGLQPAPAAIAQLRSLQAAGQAAKQLCVRRVRRGKDGVEKVPYLRGERGNV